MEKVIKAVEQRLESLEVLLNNADERIEASTKSLKKNQHLRDDIVKEMDELNDFITHSNGLENSSPKPINAVDAYYNKR